MDLLVGMAAYSTNVFGGNDLDNSIIRIQVVYGWHRLNEFLF